jgi:class 3 adenylate cyclase
MTESVLAHLLNGQVSLGGESIEVTVLFSDIRSFATISESMDAQTLVGLFNEYFTEMVSIIMKHGGVVDKIVWRHAAPFAYARALASTPAKSLLVILVASSEWSTP